MRIKKTSNYIINPIKSGTISPKWSPSDSIIFNFNFISIIQNIFVFHIFNSHTSHWTVEMRKYYCNFIISYAYTKTISNADSKTQINATWFMALYVKTIVKYYYKLFVKLNYLCCFWHVNMIVNECIRCDYTLVYYTVA